MRLPTLSIILFFTAVMSTLSADTSLTVYNDNFGVVRDSVTLSLEKGTNSVSYSGVTSYLEPESVVLRDPAGEKQLEILEQSYRGDPIDQNKLLAHFQGQRIEFEVGRGDEEYLVEGKIVRAPEPQNQLQALIKVDGKLQFGLPGKPHFPALSDASILKPTLSWILHSPKATQFDAQLSYLTERLNWKADYNLVMPEEGNQVSLVGWVSVDNQTGKTFEDARVKLIAGDVNRVRQQNRRQRAYAVEYDAPLASRAKKVQQKKFDAYHLYGLPRPLTLRDQETKQVEFIRAEGVDTKTIYVYDGAQLSNSWRNRGVQANSNYGQNEHSKVEIYREFKNSESNHLGMPLPAGKIRFYRTDEADNQLEFTGENVIDHTPRNETVRVFTGNAFDLVGERTQTSFEKHRHRDQLTERFEIEIRNRSKKPVTVNVVEHLYRWSNWEILQKNHSYEKVDARTIKFPVEVGSDETGAVEYTVRYTW